MALDSRLRGNDEDEVACAASFAKIGQGSRAKYFPTADLALFLRDA
ncbi:MAG TPA: hypothetical protein VFE24_06340 [Pirellulales bacterium]|jgi:hypothetical protein|nr:hypothetical protein [Pirellulales bacterium]